MPSESGPLKWRFVAGRVTGANATFAVGIPLSTVNHTVVRLLVTTAVIGTLALIGSLFLAWFAVRRAFRPLTRIEDTAAAIANGDLTQRIPVRQADDEVTSLARSLNVMLARIESSFAVREASEERMRQFVADASHELRTPLATVRGYAELYRQGAVPDSAAVGSAMERIEAESTRMSGLVEDLLTLARIDDAPVVETTQVDLTVLAADAVADARVRAPERRISLLGLDSPVAPTVVRGTESRLRQVVTNLVANALRHTPDGTPVEVAVGHDATASLSRCATTGPGCPTRSRPRCSSASTAPTPHVAAPAAAAAASGWRSSRPSWRSTTAGWAWPRPRAAARPSWSAFHRRLPASDQGLCHLGRVDWRQVSHDRPEGAHPR